MKITPNNWLYNAGIIGLLRILRTKGITFDDQLGQGYFELLPDHLSDFEIPYFSYVANVYNPFIAIYHLAKKQGKIKAEPYRDLKNVQHELKNHINQLKTDYYQMLKKSLLDVTDERSTQTKSIISGFFEELEKLLSANKDFDDETQKIVSKLFDPPKVSSHKRKLDEIRETTIEKILDWYFVYISLQPFYKNKAVIGQAQLKGSRLDNFNKEFVNPALKILQGMTKTNLSCRFCGQSVVDEILVRKEKPDKFTFNETLFYTTGTSVNDFKNFFYNLQSDMFFCDVCELILLCAWAGFNQIPFQFRSSNDDTEYIFVNLPSIQLMLKENDIINNLYENAQRQRNDTIYEEIFSDLFIREKKEKSHWVLQNILFLEIRNSYQGKHTERPIFRYFHVGKDVAELFTDEFAIKSMKYISGRTEVQKNKNLYIKKEVVRRFLNSEQVYDLAFKILVQVVKNRKGYPYNLFCIAILDSIRKNIWLKYTNLKQNRGKPMDSKQIYGILRGISNAGAKLIGEFVKEDIKKDFEKRQRLSYRMLSLIRTGKYAAFYDVIMKLHIDASKPIPEVLLGILNTGDSITFEAKAYAFMSGFLKDAQTTQQTIEQETEPLTEKIAKEE